MASTDEMFIKTSIIIGEIIGGFIVMSFSKKCNKIEPFIERT